VLVCQFELCEHGAALPAIRRIDSRLAARNGDGPICIPYAARHGIREPAASSGENIGCALIAVADPPSGKEEVARVSAHCAHRAPGPVNMEDTRRGVRHRLQMQDGALIIPIAARPGARRIHCIATGGWRGGRWLNGPWWRRNDVAWPSRWRSCIW